MVAATKTKESRSKSSSAAAETLKAQSMEAAPAPRGSTAHAGAGEAKGEHAKQQDCSQPERNVRTAQAAGHCTRADQDAAGRTNKRISSNHEQQ
ncbi:hypothetical protein ACU4HD_23300 [Cupriavidus basilensis]